MNSIFILSLMFVLTLCWLSLAGTVRDLKDKVALLENETEALYKLLWRQMGISESVSRSPSVSSSEPPSPSFEPVDDPWETNDSNDSYVSGDSSHFNDLFTVCSYCKARNSKGNLTCSSCGGNL
jgi:hypothetical protein